MVIQGPPSGCVLREIPGVTQVEKGHEGNTPVVTAYICWMEHRIYTYIYIYISCGINSDETREQ